MGNTALHIAAEAGYPTVVKLLMEYGASPLIENKVWLSLVSKLIWVCFGFALASLCDWLK